MNFETAEVSLLGDRASNQDRATIVTADSGWLLAVADGMGGHSDGELAAASAIQALVDAFRHCPHPVEDATGFIENSLMLAHQAVVKLGEGLEFESRPRTTATLVMIEEDIAHFGHIGDSRIYHLRDGAVLFRTRDHSHVEMLFQQGKITEDQMQSHPLRHYVESCLGGEPERPLMSSQVDCQLQAGDVLLLCSDGMWTPLNEEAMAELLCTCQDPQTTLEELAAAAVQACHPAADNTTAVMLRVEAD